MLSTQREARETETFVQGWVSPYMSVSFCLELSFHSSSAFFFGGGGSVEGGCYGNEESSSRDCHFSGKIISKVDPL